MENIKVHHQSIPSPLGTSLVLTAVLTQDAQGKFAAYLAVDRDPSMQSDATITKNTQWIATYGRKLRYTDALSYFPELLLKDYRL